MSRGYATLVALSVPLMACGMIRGTDTAIASSYMLGGSGFVRGGYSKPPAVDKADFQPAGGTMALDTSSGLPLELNLILDARLYISPTSYVGMQTHYLSFYLGNSSCNNEFSNCQTLRTTMIDWWDPVLAEDVVLKRSPSIGWIFGSEYGKSLNRKVVELSISARKYEMAVDTFRGIDCVGCRNDSGIMSSNVVSSGLALRTALRAGSEIISAIGWIELLSNHAAIGFGIVFLPGRFEE